MTKKPTTKTTTEGGRSQIDKFKEAARRHEADESEEAFDAIVKKIAKAPPPKPDKAKP
jgi:hypothetical protein